MGKHVEQGARHVELRILPPSDKSGSARSPHPVLTRNRNFREQVSSARHLVPQGGRMCPRSVTDGSEGELEGVDRVRLDDAGT
jgi:hypothetical protein